MPLNQPPQRAGIERISRLVIVGSILGALPVPDNLFTRFVAAVPDRGKVFLRPPGAPAIAYGDAFARAAQFAHVLSRHGLKRGDRVAVQTEKSPAGLILYLACLRAGVGYFPLNTGYTPAQLALFVQGATPKIFFAAGKNI